MKTLYDLLGALPDDDADSLRAAFRKAAKANHPDNNPGDPDAPRRFRRVVRANAILSDARQRSTYDQLLKIALQQQGLKSRRGTLFDTIRKLASDTITVAALSVALFAGYLLSGHVSRALFVTARPVEVSAHEPAQTALVMSAELPDTLGRVGPSDKPNDIAAPEKLENAQVSGEAATPSAIAPAESAEDIAEKPNSAPVSDFGTNDARYYRERGISAYRRGDFSLALADFDLAISLDPGLSDAHVDRGIVFHRMGDLKRAFADVAEAKRIDDLNRSAASPGASAP